MLLLVADSLVEAKPFNNPYVNAICVDRALLWRVLCVVIFEVCMFAQNMRWLPRWDDLSLVSSR